MKIRTNQEPGAAPNFPGMHINVLRGLIRRNQKTEQLALCAGPAVSFRKPEIFPPTPGRSVIKENGNG
jgi:hypothetical protein